MTTAKQAELVPVQPAPIQTVEPQGSAQEAMFERLARDPNASVDKIERLMALWERGEARKAETAFNGAMSLAQSEMRRISADAVNPQTHSRYASYAKLDAALRPIYTSHGFALSFNSTPSEQPEMLRVICTVRHLAGHAEPFQIDMPADGKGAKGGDVMTKTHAVGSGVSYAMRYLLKMIFNVAVGEDDDDGNRASPRQQTPTHYNMTPAPVVTAAPEGYQQWLDDLSAVADEGWAKFSQHWKDSKVEYTARLAKTEPKTLASLNTRARKVQVSA